MKATPEQKAKLDELQKELQFYVDEIAKFKASGAELSGEWYDYVAKGIRSDIDALIAEQDTVDCPADCQCHEIDAEEPPAEKLCGHVRTTVADVKYSGGGF